MTDLKKLIEASRMLAEVSLDHCYKGVLKDWPLEAKAREVLALMDEQQPCGEAEIDESKLDLRIDLKAASKEASKRIQARQDEPFWSFIERSAKNVPLESRDRALIWLKEQYDELQKRVEELEASRVKAG